jgi:hypothetical protein
VKSCQIPLPAPLAVGPPLISRLRLMRRSPTGHVASFVPELFFWAYMIKILKYLNYSSNGISV